MKGKLSTGVNVEFSQKEYDFIYGQEKSAPRFLRDLVRAEMAKNTQSQSQGANHEQSKRNKK